MKKLAIYLAIVAAAASLESCRTHTVAADGNPQPQAGKPSSLSLIHI